MGMWVLSGIVMFSLRLVLLIIVCEPSLKKSTTRGWIVCIYIYSTSTPILLSYLPAKSGIDVMFCLQKYQGLQIKRSLVYLSYLKDRINTQVVYPSEVYRLVF